MIKVLVYVNIDADEFPEELRKTATSLSCETGHKISRKELVSSLLKNFEILYDEFIHNNNIKDIIDICRESSILIGKDVKIIKRNEELFGKAIDLSDSGELIVQYPDGSIEEIVSGEVSIRGINGDYTP